MRTILCPMSNIMNGGHVTGAILVLSAESFPTIFEIRIRPSSTIHTFLRTYIRSDLVLPSAYTYAARSWALSQREKKEGKESRPGNRVLNFVLIPTWKKIFAEGLARSATINEHKSPRRIKFRYYQMYKNH